MDRYFVLGLSVECHVLLPETMGQYHSIPQDIHVRSSIIANNYMELYGKIKNVPKHQPATEHRDVCVGKIIFFQRP